MTLLKTSIFISGWTWTVRNSPFQSYNSWKWNKNGVFRGLCITSQEVFKVTKRHRIPRNRD